MSHPGIIGRWADQVERRPDAPAAVTPDRRWSHLELAEWTAGLRARLPGGDRGPVLVACAEPVPVAAALLACAATGRTVACADVRQPAPRWTELLEDLRPAAVLADRAGRAALAGAGPAGAVPVVGAESVRPRPWQPREWRDGAAPDGGYVYFTSGTTGRPKGIRGSMAAVAHFVDWEIAEFGIRPGTRVSQLTSPGFDAFLRDALVPLCAGGTMHAPGRAADAGAVPVGAGLARWLREERVEVLHSVPTVFRTLRTAGLTAGSLPDLRAVLLAGEPLRSADVAWWRGLFGDGIELVNLYGPSETTMTKVFHRTTAADAGTGTVPAGRPMPGVAVRVLVAGRPAEDDAIGEIEIETPFPLAGYLDGRTGGFTGTHRYRTGDLGRLRPDGALEVLGRRDRQVKVNGVRVEPAEVEDVLRRHPGVTDACAAAVAEGEGDPVLCAYVVADEVPDDALRAHAEAHLAPGARPAVYVRLVAVPRTLSGKVDRRALPAPSAAASAGREAPGEGLETEIAAVWSELLRLPAVGRRDDFSLLGGDSLAVARLLDRLRVRFGVDVPVRVFAAEPTVAGLAAAVAARTATAAGAEGGDR
ncbi:hypothetical protein GCM10027168_09520 [Streptomyces capparidis]